MIRETSIEAYNKIKANGLLSVRSWQVYRTICEAGIPVNTRQIWHLVNKRGIDSSDRTISSVVSKLVREGAVRELPKKPCPHTGNNVYWFEETGDLPVTVPRTITIKKKIQILEEQLAVAIHAIEYVIMEMDMLDPRGAKLRSALEEIEEIKVRGKLRRPGRKSNSRH